MNFTFPFILSQIIEFTTNTDAPLWHGIFYAVTLLGISFLMSICNGQSQYRNYTFGFRIRGALINAIYRKAITISKSAIKENTTVGEIVNLMSVDAQRLVKKKELNMPIS